MEQPFEQEFLPEGGFFRRMLEQLGGYRSQVRHRRQGCSMLGIGGAIRDFDAVAGSEPAQDRLPRADIAFVLAILHHGWQALGPEGFHRLAEDVPTDLERTFLFALVGQLDLAGHRRQRRGQIGQAGVGSLFTGAQAAGEDIGVQQLAGCDRQSGADAGGSVDVFAAARLASSFLDEVVEEVGNHRLDTPSRAGDCLLPQDLDTFGAGLGIVGQHLAADTILERGDDLAA